MLMNRVETALINSPPRRWVQRWYETPLLLRMGGPLDEGARALEIGCGSGYGVQLILERFGAGRVDAIDLDPAMVTRARRRLARYRGRVRVGVADATDLTGLVPRDGTYDAVFDNGIIHHIPEWRKAVAEVARVLRPGGLFYFGEVTAHALARPSYRLLFDHPEHDRFTGRRFLDVLDDHGLTVRASRELVFGDFVLGVAQKSVPRDRPGAASERQP
ncbi:type 11 methyltransferase [Actinomadura rubrobrunea]|uniref:Type 11 methyltransferase n=1 Tax=Actinomadura rubrobrunea TaxID=115335 RepID=A0A9W6UWD3_9ACTN|nr:class I SAM-dependent methyltransferase [Actinomadura rubrobrunea]GLW66049.1 type 11 methyltransferase [Actinomadura rubrobrunea]